MRIIGKNRQDRQEKTPGKGRGFFARAGRFLPVAFFGLFFSGVFLAPEMAWASSRQPIVLSPKCSTGGEKADALFEKGVDFEMARKGVAPDLYRAERLYEKALTMGSARAALYLGRLYRQVFIDVPAYSPRLQFQVALFERSIGMGCPDGYLFLAEVYQNGWGVAPNLAMAWRLVREGAEKGSMAAMTAWGANLYFENRFDNSPAAQAKRKEAKAWLEKALKGGYGDAGHELAIIYRTYEYDPKNAIRALRDGARLGNADCLYMLAGIYRYGEDGQPKDTAYADVADALLREIDVTETPKPIAGFSRWLPEKPVMPYRANTP